MSPSIIKTRPHHIQYLNRYTHTLICRQSFSYILRNEVTRYLTNGTFRISKTPRKRTKGLARGAALDKPSSPGQPHLFHAPPSSRYKRGPSSPSEILKGGIGSLVKS